MGEVSGLYPICPDVWDELLQRDVELGGPLHDPRQRPVGRVRASALDEREVLGAALECPDLVPVLSETVSPEDYHDSAHAALWRAILGAYALSGTLTPPSVAAALRGASTLDLVGGPRAVEDLREYAPGYARGSGSFVAAALGAARRVAEHASMRRVAQACAAIHADAHDWRVPAHDVLARLASVQTTAARGQAPVVPIGHGAEEAIEDLIARSLAGEGPAGGVSTGLPTLDEQTNTLRPSQLVVLGARPGVGKTALALQIAAHAAETVAPVLFFSQEMARRELFERLAANRAGVRLGAIINPKLLRPAEIAALRAWGPYLRALPLLVRDAAGVTIGQLRAVARAEHARSGRLSMVVVDYLQLVRPDARHDNREQEVREIADGLKELAKELEVPVLALAQLNRASENGAREPRKSDLRESGAIEANADVIGLLHRPSDDPTRIKLLFDKQRSGASGGDAALIFDGALQRFSDPSTVSVDSDVPDDWRDDND